MLLCSVNRHFHARKTDSDHFLMTAFALVPWRFCLVNLSWVIRYIQPICDRRKDGMEDLEGSLLDCQPQSQPKGYVTNSIFYHSGDKVASNLTSKNWFSPYKLLWAPWTFMNHSVSHPFLLTEFIGNFPFFPYWQTSPSTTQRSLYHCQREQGSKILNGT